MIVSSVVMGVEGLNAQSYHVMSMMVLKHYTTLDLADLPPIHIVVVGAVAGLPESIAFATTMVRVTYIVISNGKTRAPDITNSNHTTQRPVIL